MLGLCQHVEQEHDSSYLAGLKKRSTELMRVKQLAWHLVHKGTGYRLVIVLSIRPGTQGDYCLEMCQEKVSSYTSFNRGGTCVSPPGKI